MDKKILAILIFTMVCTQVAFSLATANFNGDYYHCRGNIPLDIRHHNLFIKSSKDLKEDAEIILGRKNLYNTKDYTTLAKLDEQSELFAKEQIKISNKNYNTFVLALQDACIENMFEYKARKEQETGKEPTDEEVDDYMKKLGKITIEEVLFNFINYYNKAPNDKMLKFKE